MLSMNQYMNSTAKALWDHFDNKSDFHDGIKYDLFGYSNIPKRSDEIFNMFYELYKGLYLMDVTYREIYRCYLNNKLDELIHTKYSYIKSGYYKQFCDTNWIHIL